MHEARRIVYRKGEYSIHHITHWVWGDGNTREYHHKYQVVKPSGATVDFQDLTSAEKYVDVLRDVRSKSYDHGKRPFRK